MTAIQIVIRYIVVVTSIVGNCDIFLIENKKEQKPCKQAAKTRQTKKTKVHICFNIKNSYRLLGVNNARGWLIRAVTENGIME